MKSLGYRTAATQLTFSFLCTFFFWSYIKFIFQRTRSVLGAESERTFIRIPFVCPNTVARSGGSRAGRGHFRGHASCGEENLRPARSRSPLCASRSAVPVHVPLSVAAADPSSDRDATDRCPGTSRRNAEPKGPGCVGHESGSHAELLGQHFGF